MCGIAGFADSRVDRGWNDNSDATANDNATLGRMCEAIRHRGPDDEGRRLMPGVALGMRRLSIIDLATGQQPIHNEDQSVWVVFNGEIYNYAELRAELIGRGHRFYTNSDTETIVHAYEEWGQAGFARLRGMFGIALWDSRDGSLWLARDRVGIKPLHYTVIGGRLYFASEIKSILASGGINPTLDFAALDHYLSFLYTPRDASIFAGIQKLPPGHLLQWHAGRQRITPYWEMPSEQWRPASEQEAADSLRGVLRDAVRSHLMSEVPLGAFLSGGVDSSLVVGLMAEASTQPVRTFSIGFDDPRYDELEHARVVARHFATDHHEFVVKPDALAIIDDLIAHFDEPFGDSSAIPTWYVSEIARQHVTVVLSGDGGDELFGGYERYSPHPRIAAFDRYAPPASRKLASLVWPLLPHGATGKNFLRRVARDDRGRYLDQIGYFQPDEKRALLSDDVLRATGNADAEARLGRHFARLSHLPWDAQMMHFDFATYLPEDILTKVDRMSMAHSIESRVPLLDNSVVDFAATLPADLKIKNGRKKHLLKEAAANLLPSQILNRRKQGFAVPVGGWFRGDLRDFFADVLLSQRARQRGYFNGRFVDRIVREHMTGRRDHTLRLWALVVFELWHRQYLDPAPTVYAPAFTPPVSVAS
ncbi:MAG TPA: asparagine synthase (glutamine-hydrolyzing) [Vicinamibacterales bacterium]|nr:asparagine synthase (glutamine-hydrolyzing) [Vicinamibacterales bacterium]